jgi:hypothetical protein
MLWAPLPPPGSGVQRCAQAGEREHRIDSTAGTASCAIRDFQRSGLFPAPAEQGGAGMSVELRHYCRNPRCRTKLSTPVENEHHAFCIRGCYESFYRNRCRVCERDLRKTGKRGDANRLYCRPPRDCRTEAGKWPQQYDYGQLVGFSANNVRSAHSTGLKFGLAGNPPSAHGLRDWWWGDPVEGDLPLYDRDGLTIGRLVLAADGRYRLQSPITRPRLSWPTLDEAKRGAESFALMAMPIDPKLAARIKRSNETPHPMGEAR